MAKILLIETDAVLAGNLCKFFGKHGHKVTWYVDPQRAIESADKSNPDLIIIDLILASHSGVEFLYELRSYPDWQSMPVIIFSNISSRELGEAASELEQLHISAYHYKPYTSFAQLAKTVEQALKPAAV